MKLFVVVIKQVTFSMESFHNEADLLDFLGSIGSKGDGRTIEKVFSVNIYGAVTKYEVKFDGKLRLEEVPNVKGTA